MEVFFCEILNFFPKPCSLVHRQEDQAQQQGRPVGGQPHHKQGGRTEQQKIEQRPQEEGYRHIDAHLAAAGGGGVAEEARRDQDPEAQIQQGAHQGEAEAPP